MGRETAGFSGAAGPAVALSGSCSTQSLLQVAAFSRTHPAPDHARPVMDGAMTAEIAAAWALERLPDYPMIYSSATPESVAAAQAKFAASRWRHALNI